MKAVLLISHGSRSSKTKEEIVRLCRMIKEKISMDIIRFAFLEIEQPSIPEGIEQCVLEGANEITILLNFLNSGKHVDEDIPAIIRHAEQKYSHVKFTITRPITQYDLMADFYKTILDEEH